MRSLIQKHSLSISIFFIILVYASVATSYNETLLNGDAGYTYLQLREFLLGHHFDLMYKGVDYCAVLEPFFAVLFSYFIPVGVSLLLGVLTFYLIGFFQLRSRYTPAKQGALLLLLTVALPNPAYQAWGALGAHNLIVFAAFILSYFFSHSRYKTESGDYKLWVYAAIAVIGGFSTFTYVLSKTVAYAAVLTLAITFLLNQRHQLFKRPLAFFKSFSIRIAIVWIGFRIGLLPRKINLHYFHSFHTGGGTPSLNFTYDHWIHKFRNFLELLSHQYTPVFSHKWTLANESVYSHINYPLNDVLIHNSGLGLVIGSSVLILSIFGAAYFCIKKFDAFRFFWLTCVSAQIVAYFIRGDFDSTIAYESRYLLVLYFGSLLLLLDLSTDFSYFFRKIAYGILAVVIIFSGISHATIFKTYQQELQSLQASKNCTSLSQSEVYSVIQALHPEALVGTYWEVWSLAAVLKLRYVYDLRHDRFSYNTEKTIQKKLTVVLSRQEKLDETAVLHLKKVTALRSFTQTQLGPYSFGFENDTLHTPEFWKKEIMQAILKFDKNECLVTQGSYTNFP